jgi:hypothetical protein
VPARFASPSAITAAPRCIRPRSSSRAVLRPSSRQPSAAAVHRATSAATRQSSSLNLTKGLSTHSITITIDRSVHSGVKRHPKASTIPRIVNSFGEPYVPFQLVQRWRQMGSTSDDQDLRAFRIREVCVRTALGRTTVYAAIKSGDLVARKYGRRTIVLERDLRNFLSRLPNSHDLDLITP